MKEEALDFATRTGRKAFRTGPPRSLTPRRGRGYSYGMQQLRPASDRLPPADICARELLAGVPAVMWFLRHQVRSHRQRGLTVPQFRSLVFLVHHNNASLSEMAEHLVLSLPATSRMVEVLVKRGLMRRKTRATDRRHVSLSLTAQGRSAFRTAHEATQVALAERLRALPSREVLQVAGAMRILGRLFAPNGEQTDHAER
jgi:DNA-binding MarR family transcriptional regulator